MKINRRTFAKIFGSFSFTSLITQQKTLALSEAKCIELTDFKGVITWPQNKIYSWVSGIKNSSVSRGTLAILLKHKQEHTHYIDKIALKDNNDHVIYTQYYTSNDKISSGYLPYILIQNLDLSLSQLFLYIQVRKDADVIRYRYAFSKLEPSKLDGQDLPAEVRTDLDNSFKGIITTPFYLKKTKPLQAHNIKSEVKYLDAVNNSFLIQIYFMHKDTDENHYMRYFIVTDPVGRILGIKKRDYIKKSFKNMVLISNISDEERNDRWRITKDMIAHIGDCPYIMIFCDDIKEALAKTTIWLR